MTWLDEQNKINKTLQNLSWFDEPCYDYDLNDIWESHNADKIKVWDVISKVQTKWEVDFGSEGGETAGCEGDNRLRKIRYYLDHVMDALDWHRSESQIAFHNSYIIAALPKIYGKSWEANQARVLKEFNITSIKALVLALTPRRWGKTVAVACFISVFLICVPGIVISTFSTGRRASGLMMEMVKKILFANEGIEERVVRTNVEELQIGQAATIRTYTTGSQFRLAQERKREARRSNISIFHSYPSNPDGQKHTTDIYNAYMEWGMGEWKRSVQKIK